MTDYSSDKPDECIGCPFYHTGKGFVVPSSGSAKKGGVMLLGRSPEDHELEEGEPFAAVYNERTETGSFGYHLVKWLRWAGLERKECHRVNTIWCKAPEEYTKTSIPRDVITHCTSRYLKRYIEAREPDVIVAFGNEAFSTLTSLKGISNWRGTVIKPDAPMGHSPFYAQLNVNAKPFVVGTLLNIIKAWEYVPIVTNDLRRAREVRDGTWSQIKPQYSTSLDVFDENFREIMQSPAIGVDMEGWDVPIVLSISWAPGRAVSLNVHEYKEIIRTILGPDGPPKLYIHNGISYDSPRLEKHLGVAIEAKVFDTMLASWLLNGGDLPVSLAFNASVHTDMSYWKWLKEIHGYTDSVYNCKDGDAHYRLGVLFEELLPAKGLDKLYERIVLPLAKSIRYLNDRGVKIDRDAFFRARASMDTHVEELKSELQEYVGNPNSWQQILKYFKTNGAPPPYDRKKGKVSTEADALEFWLQDYALACPEVAKFVNKLKDFRKGAKLMSTFFNPANLIGDCFMAEYMLHRAADETKGGEDVKETLVSTGRLSSSPNIQNWPRSGPARKCVIPHHKDWVLVAFDYRQQEYLDALRSAGDFDLARRIIKGEFDIHSHVRDAIGTIDRTTAKRSSYLTLYGGGPRKISKILQIPEDIARAAQDAFFSASPLLKAHMREVVEEGYAAHQLRNEYGRVRYFWYRDVPKMLDFLPQSNCADYMNYHWVNELVPALPYGIEHIMFLVHDEVMLQSPRGMVDEIVRIGIDALSCPDWGINFSYPVDVKVGENWGSMIPYEEWKRR